MGKQKEEKKTSGINYTVGEKWERFAEKEKKRKITNNGFFSLLFRQFSCQSESPLTKYVFYLEW